MESVLSMACRYAKQYICAEFESQKWPAKRERAADAGCGSLNVVQRVTGAF
jgi:hypothetical protein